jgi:hypothetical protein
MKHEIDEATRAIVRSAITTIRRKFNLNRKDAESYFRRNVGTCDVHESLMVAVADDIQEQKEMALEIKQDQRE